MAQKDEPRTIAIGVRVASPLPAVDLPG
ncbi:MAG: hypothetical protein RLZZ238_17, partial [Planctomycetota bacterium]